MSSSPSSSGEKSRLCAAQILVQVLDQGEGLGEAVAAVFGRGAFRGLDERDRAFARLLAITVLRHLRQIDSLLLPHLKKGFPPKLPLVTAVLRVGAGEMAFLDKPAHSALHCAVEIVGRSPRTARLKGLVNAVLRRVSEGLPADSVFLENRSVNFPDWLLTGWEDQYGVEEARRMVQASLGDPPLDLTVKDPSLAGAWAERLGGVLLPTGSVRLRLEGRVERLEGFAEGAWWVQDAAAALPARLLGDMSGKEVFDLCAAPGGKTLQLAAAGAKVTAVDRSADRLKRLRENLERTGLGAAVVASDLKDWQPERPADAVLLDAPCSATGTLRRHPEILYHRQADDIARLAALQAVLLAKAAEFVAPGGQLVYCTCSLERREGEDIVAQYLSEAPDFVRKPLKPADIGGCAEFLTADGDVRSLPSLWPETGGVDGFYAARLRRVR